MFLDHYYSPHLIQSLAQSTEWCGFTLHVAHGTLELDITPSEECKMCTYRYSWHSLPILCAFAI